MLGALTIFVSFLYSVYALYAKFWSHTPQGFTALIIAITFVGGANLFFLGIIGEYVGRVYEETKGRPHYVIRDIFSQHRAYSEQTSRVRDVHEVLPRVATGTD